MRKPTLTEVENAFQPAREIDAAARFAGRKEAVSTAYYALIGRGSNIAVVGNRGIGKTSLARQIGNIATGDQTLLKRLNLPYDRRLDFLSIYFACGNSIRTTSQLLERLLTTSSCLGDWIYDIPKAAKELDTYAPELGAKVFGIGANIKAQSTTEKEFQRAVLKHPIDAVFTNVCRWVVESDVASDGLLITIDEFDQVRNPSGMAGLLKSLATNVPGVKICIVGVAQDIQNLLCEHESTDRLFAGSIIRLPPMSPDELSDIVRIAEASIHGYIKFSDNAIKGLVRLAQGHPYMVHLT